MKDRIREYLLYMSYPNDALAGDFAEGAEYNSVVFLELYVAAPLCLRLKRGVMRYGDR
ncbi:MAG: hypothetical protein JXA96_07895 [Sedimentisphaerales bacterium]|nr:hypothetical protein [Sedimentisphaerales bacterium]